MLNHPRFYLPQVYPKLDEILFSDDDIAVQKDLTPLWSEDLRGKINGAVETCGESFHQFDKYLNFSNPRIARRFDPNARGWAHGMNVFDLKKWKKQDITGIYHKWQQTLEILCQLEYYLFSGQSIPIFMAITKMILTEGRISLLSGITGNKCAGGRELVSCKFEG